MRTIKFRAWHGGLMYDITTIHFNVRGIRHIDMINEETMCLYHADTLDTIALMQFTGLHDKNGKEVYEGDILGHPSRSPLLVEWGYLDNGDSETDCYGWMGNQDWDKRIVIGNIYEHPELLKGKQ